MSAPTTSNATTPQPKPIILTGPGHLSSVIVEAEAVLVSLDKYFVDCRHETYSGALRRFLSRELAVKLSERHDRRATPQDLLLDLDANAEFRSSLTGRRVAVPKKLPEEILRRAKHSDDSPFEDVF